MNTHFDDPKDKPEDLPATNGEGDEPSGEDENQDGPGGGQPIEPPEDDKP